MELLKATTPVMIRPSDTTQYAALDLVANSTTTGSVINRIFTFDVFPGQLELKRCTMMKTDTDIVTAGFNLHLFDVAPTYSVSGDNGAMSANTTVTLGSYLGTMLIASMVATKSHAIGQGIPLVGEGIRWRPTHTVGQQTVDLYGVLSTVSTYTPSSAGTTQITIEGDLRQPGGY
jgi:hypothetical protein